MDFFKKISRLSYCRAVISSGARFFLVLRSEIILSIELIFVKPLFVEEPEPSFFPQSQVC